nr:40S ribosomal protein S13 [Tanacetum cinerariifolium]
MAHVPKPPTSRKPKTEKKKKKKKTKKEIQITWSSPNYHGSYPLNNDELEVWNLFRSTEKAVPQPHMIVDVGKDLDMVDKDDRVIHLIGKFAVDTFNRSCQMYVNKDEDNQVSGTEFMECKFYKFSSQYFFYMTIEAIEQGIPGVYKTSVECDSDGARTLMNFKLTDRKPKSNRPWVKPCLEPELEYETVQDGSSDPQDYYELTGLVHRDTEGGGFNYHNPVVSPHRLVYTSIKDETASDFADFEEFVPNVTEPLNSGSNKNYPDGPLM